MLQDYTTQSAQTEATGVSTVGKAGQSMPDHIQALITQEMKPGETVRWVGKPTHLKAIALVTLSIWLFAVPWTGFSVFWIAGAAQFKVPDFKHGMDFFPLFGLPFFFIGLAMLSAPYWAVRAAKNTYYVITGQRAMILKGIRSVEIESFGPDKLKDLKKMVAPDGSGKIVFTTTITTNSRGNNSTTQKGFFGIDAVNEVENMLQDIVNAAGS